MKKHLVSSLMLLSCSLYAVESRIEIRNREAAGVGYSRGYTSLDYFLMTEDSVEFLLDARGHVFNNGQGAGNIGLGFRCPVNGEKYLVGANAFYDIRQSTGLFANQVGAGIEWIGRYVDFRTNGYLPVGKKKDLDTKKFKTFSGTSVLIRRKLKSTLPCIDAEVGTPLPKPFYFAVGGYYLFKQSESSLAVGNAFGAKARAEVDIGRYVTLGFAITYDHIFKTRPQGYISINIPFYQKKCRKDYQDDELCHMPEARNLRRVPIMRNEIIPIQVVKKSKDPLVGVKGETVRVFFVNNMAKTPGNGSFEQPFALLKDAEKNSAPGDVIYVFAGDKTSKNMNEGIVLKDKQVLASSGVPLVLNEIIIPPQTPGSRPTIGNVNIDKPKGSQLKIDDFVTNPGNTHLNDFFFIPPWEYIFGRGIDHDHFEVARDEGFHVIEPERDALSMSSFEHLGNSAAPAQSIPESPISGGLDQAMIIDNYSRR